MNRPREQVPVPALTGSAVYATVATLLAAGGLPVPRTVDLYPGYGHFAPYVNLGLAGIDELWTWAQRLDIPVEIQVATGGKRVTGKARGGHLAGVAWELYASEPLDDEATIDARDRAADIADLAAARAVGAVA